MSVVNSEAQLDLSGGSAVNRSNVLVDRSVNLGTERGIANRMFGADRIARTGDKVLGRFQLDGPTRSELTSTAVGVFAEGMLRLDSMVQRLLMMTERNGGMRAVVVYASKIAGESIYRSLREEGHTVDGKLGSTTWNLGSLTFTSVEGLSRLDCGEDIAAMFLLDPTCMVHKASGFQTFRGVHSRPQIVANFLHDRTNSDGTKPTFVLMTCKKAAALGTNNIARAYCLDAFLFVDGMTLR